MHKARTNNTAFVIIPFDYEQLPESVRRRIVPICIEGVDRQGSPIASVWFEQGVAPIRTELTTLARVELGDAWLVSQLVELSVHKLWGRHGGKAGDTPWRRVWRQAVWDAKDLSAGDWRTRKYRVIYSAFEELDQKFPEQMIDPRDYNSIYNQRVLLDSLAVRLHQEGPDEIAEAYELVRLGHTWREIGATLGRRSEEPLRRRFYRWAHKNKYDTTA